MPVGTANWVGIQVRLRKPSLTLPALKRRGFLDLRPALNLRVQMAISKPKSRQD